MKTIKMKLFLLMLFITGSLLQGDVLAQNNTIKTPNIVFIIGDDISVDDFGCYGNKQVKTPNIDRIAKEGLRFTNGQLIYSIANSQPSTSVSQLIYNTIETPKGGQYQINLPDGSKVWLNAASSLRFPASFPGNERKVELTGEAYFEIAHIDLPGGRSRSGAPQAMPFKVISGRQTVEVLGTHFNINAYSDEHSIRTTLLEGSVRVSMPFPEGKDSQGMLTQILKPGQQSKVNQTINVFNVDAGEAVAWKNGYFMFNNENIQSVMRKISRWYNVDIEYQGDVSQKALWGSVSRFKNVSEV